MSRNGSPRFLVIRRDNIGDLVCTTPFISALRVRHPDAYIAVLVNSYNRDILAGNPDVDEVFAYTKAKHRGANRTLLSVLFERATLLLRLRRAGIDLAVLAAPGFQPRSLRLARLAGAKQVLGFVNRQGEGRIEMGVPVGDAKALHEVEDVFRLAAPLGIDAAPQRMTLVPDRQKRGRVEGQISTYFGDRRGPVVAVHISARKPSQRWPGERFSTLIRRMAEEFDARILLLWSPGAAENALHPGDDAKAEAIITALGGVPALAVPTLELGDLVAALAACDIMICADGGAMHVAAALGKPVVCMFGDSAGSRWYPWKTRYELLQPDSRNVADIDVAQVFAATQRLLEFEQEKNLES